MEPTKIEAGFEEVQITLKTSVDLYIGRVMECPDPQGRKVLCVLTEIDRVYLKRGKITVDCKVEPLHMIDRE